MFGKLIGVDLGTVNVLIYIKGKGIVLQEPSVVAISLRDNRIVAVGNDAKEMMERTSENIEVMRPMRDGVIADYVVTEAMLRYFVERAAGRRRFLGHKVMISVPVGVTSVERRAVHEAALQTGAREAYLIWEPLAAALGVGMPIGTPTGSMVVNIGGGTSEAALVSMNEIIASSSVRVGGVRIDEAIVSYVRKKYNLMIGSPTAEEVKFRIGSALPLEEEMSMEVQGRDQVAGLPRTITLTSGEVTEAIAEPVSSIVAVVRSVLEKTPPELSADIIDRGMALVGGGALLRGMDRLLTRETSVPCYVAENPMACTATGAGRALENLHIMRRSLPEL
jgi:rod shape-determining protein MreB